MTLRVPSHRSLGLGARVWQGCIFLGRFGYGWNMTSLPLESQRQFFVKTVQLFCVNGVNDSEHSRHRARWIRHQDNCSHLGRKSTWRVPVEISTSCWNLRDVYRRTCRTRHQWKGGQYQAILNLFVQGWHKILGRHCTLLKWFIISSPNVPNKLDHASLSAHAVPVCDMRFGTGELKGCSMLRLDP
jgi:hypothetical protein